MIFLQDPIGSWKWGRKGGSLLSETIIRESNPAGASVVLETVPVKLSTARTAPERDVSGEMWFAIRVKSNCERMTALHLRERGYQQFAPTYHVRRRWSDRIKNIEKPLFPGYVFCKFRPQMRLPILTTPGVLHVLGIGKEPVPVDTREIEAVRATLEAGVLLKPWPYLQVGNRVILGRGPLSGVEGIVTYLKGNCRLVVSVTLLQRSIAAEIERDWVTPVD